MELMLGHYDDFVRRLTKPGRAVLNTLSAERVDLWHAATGIATEAGEILEQVKKHVIYNAPLDTDNLIEELGDLEFYATRLRQCLRVTRGEVITRNQLKLAKRYSRGYSDRAAQRRDDK